MFYALLTFLLFLSAPAVAQQNNAPSAQQAGAPSAQPQSQQQQVQANPVTAQMMKNGVQQCAPMIQTISNFIGINPGAGAVVFVAPQQGNQRVSSFSMEVVTADKATAYASASFTPYTQGCGAVYDAVSYWPDSCDAVAKKQFKEGKPQGKVSRNIQVLQLEGTGRVFLMPAGSSGCVSIKKEVVF